MKGLFFTIVALCICSYANSQTQLDTIYYNKNWSVTNNPAFATYYRILEKIDENTPVAQYRDFWMNGAVCGEGQYTELDPDNGEKFSFEGQRVQYYQNGQMQFKKRYANGKLDGKYTEYAPNGLVIKDCTYYNGRLHGVYTEFLENGNFKQLEYEDGYPKNNYYYMGTPSGQISRFRTYDNKIYWETPKISDRKTMYLKGESWQYYTQNGLRVAISVSRVQQYGDFFKVNIMISNNSLEEILFTPEYDLMAYTINRKGKVFLEVFSADKYMTRVKSRQTLAAAMTAIGEVSRNQNAGYSASTTQTNQVYGGNINSYGISAAAGAAVGTGGAAAGVGLGAYASNTSYIGASSTTSTTVSYSALAEYQQDILMEQKLDKYADGLLNERNAIEKGYLETTTIYPGESISGYVMVKGKFSGYSITSFLDINNCKYEFNF